MTSVSERLAVFRSLFPLPPSPPYHRTFVSTDFAGFHRRAAAFPPDIKHSCRVNSLIKIRHVPRRESRIGSRFGNRFRCFEISQSFCIFKFHRIPASFPSDNASQQSLQFAEFMKTTVNNISAKLATYVGQCISETRKHYVRVIGRRRLLNLTASTALRIVLRNNYDHCNAGRNDAKEI